MRISLKQLLAIVAFAAVLCFAATWFLRTQAADFWTYAKLGVSDGTPQSPVYYLEVGGVGKQPTIVRIVRFANRADTPGNALEVARAVSSDFDLHLQNADRWNNELTLIAGRTNDETVEIQLDTVAALEWFAQPGDRFDNYIECDEFWNELVAPNLPVKK
jgi:hypothetical protein